MKKYLIMCSIFALVSASQAEIETIFQEDFSGYAGPYPQALSSTAQIGTWNAAHLGTPTVDIRVYPLLDGSSGPCLMIAEDSASSRLILSAVAAITYAYSPITISYNFKMRHAGVTAANVLSVYTKNSDNETVSYNKMTRKNTTHPDAWISFYDAGGSGTLALDAWYTMVIELPVMPATGTFDRDVTVYDAAGAVVFSNTVTSLSADAGSELITSLMFTAPGNSDLTNVLIDDILIEAAVPIPATIWLLALGFVFLKRRRK